MLFEIDGRRNWQRVLEVFGEYDFILSPTMPLVAPRIEAWMELWKQQGGRPKHNLILDVLRHLMMCNVMGLPAISVPAGFVNGLPVAIQIIGKPGSEGQLLQAAQPLLAGQRT
jgi:Asp-tRNA(Asn)/Glu-tRNA(Gln) amidotransferase A subunit family amidase